MDPLLKISKVKTEEANSKRTLRRSIRKPHKAAKDLSTDLKKAIELPGSRLLETREEGLFLARAFEPRHVCKAKFLFRASDHNFSIAEFHRKCDG